MFPAIGEHVDDLAVIRSMHTDIPAHDVATVFMNTGSLRIGQAEPRLVGALRPRQREPEHARLHFAAARRRMPPGGALNWGSAFLPGDLQATSINTSTPTVDGMIQNIRNEYFGREEQRRQLDLVQKLNAMHSQNLQKDPQLEARIEAFEMAYRMQIEATDAFDIAKEPQSVRDAVRRHAAGPAVADRAAARRARRALRAGLGRRLGSSPGHRRPSAGKRRRDRQPRAALLTDLKQRGLLDSTLVIWGGEFGRTVTRDRNGNDNPGPRSQQQGVQHLARRRRREGRHGLRRDRRVRRDGRRRTRSTSTTCTRRSCICSASTTRS